MPRALTIRKPTLAEFRRLNRLTLEDGRALVAGFEGKARAGSLLVIVKIYQAYEK